MNPFIFYPRKNSSSIHEEMQEEMDLENNFFHFPATNQNVFPNKEQQKYRENQINLLENDFSNGLAMNFLENEEIIGGLSTNINTQNEVQMKSLEDQSLSTASSIISSQNETLKTDEEEVKSMHSQKKESKKKHKRKKNVKKSLKRKEPANNSKSFVFFVIIMLNFFNFQLFANVNARNAKKAFVNVWMGESFVGNSAIAEDVRTFAKKIPKEKMQKMSFMRKSQQNYSQLVRKSSFKSNLIKIFFILLLMIVYFG